MDLCLLGQRVRVTTSDAAFAADLARCFEGGLLPEQGVHVDLRVHADDISMDVAGCRAAHTLFTCPSDALGASIAPQTPARLAGALANWSAASTRRHSVFHAGAVAREGRGLLLPGGSRSGKTTLTAALLGRGFELLSDEVGALARDTGRLVAYPRALSIRHDAFRLLALDEDLGAELGSPDSRFVSARELGARRSEVGAEPALIIQPSVEIGTPARLERLRTGPAALALVRASCTLRAFKEVELDVSIALARRVPCYRISFSRLDPALDLIEGAFAASLLEAGEVGWSLP